MADIYFLIRVGNWKLCSDGIFRYRKYCSRTGHTRWHGWDRIFPLRRKNG